MLKKLYPLNPAPRTQSRYWGKISVWREGQLEGAKDNGSVKDINEHAWGGTEFSSIINSFIYFIINKNGIHNFEIAIYKIRRIHYRKRLITNEKLLTDILGMHNFVSK